jgi:hypothetical protein
MTDQSSMVARHKAEIAQIIADCHAGIASDKVFANYRARKGTTPPKGWTLSKARTARKKIAAAFAKCTKDLRGAVRRQRAEANAK